MKPSVKRIVGVGRRHRIRNAALALGVLLFWSVVFPDALVKGNKYVGGEDTFLALCALTAGCFIVWLVATDAVWTRLSRREPVVAFPIARIAIRGGLALNLREIDPNEPGDSVLLTMDAEVTNRQTDRPLNLDFRLKIQNEKFKTQPLSVNLHPFWPRTEQQKIYKTLDHPLHVGPVRTITGQLAFIDHLRRWIDYDALAGFKAAENCRLLMSVEDYVSGSKIEFDVPGIWERS